ncbi:Glycosyl transferase, family 4, conserved region [Methanothermus fervidus DSM 2088]|uniref:Glycosyl transferase, family 4, conserved region n=1 Tax=Methanothermus fervidus (strain ATCC 43054 / DSM 2088 / JCM 10308 / V24 S) TaxID=523846 RepID=E3GYM6_METFV|nr:glycosyltransferase 4 family protein [Methanothermus fervidus]ADP77408.1 Glycosyl transferase, family 4, conserved region [Methanothermus fervidus DSM 2088]
MLPTLSAFIVSFLATYLIMPKLIKKLKNAEIIGKDIHKPTKPLIPEMGGLGILLGFFLGVSIAYFLLPHYHFLLALVVVFFVGIVGVIDDLVNLSWKEKIFLLFFSSLPVIFTFPKTIFYLILIPLAFIVVPNLTNMLAGLNGLESGLGSIVMFFITIVCVILGKFHVTPISAAMFGSLFAFLLYNKYPARIFPGDVGTLTIGACICVVAFFGNIEFIVLIMLMPYIIDASLKFFSAGIMERSQHKPTKVTKDGLLVLPKERNFNSLIRLLLLKKPMKENEIVKIIWVIEIIFCILAVLLTYAYDFV